MLIYRFKIGAVIVALGLCTAVDGAPAWAVDDMIAEAAIQRVVDTQNKRPCSFDHPLVGHYAKSIFVVSSKRADGLYNAGNATAFGACRKMLTAGHTMFEADRTTPTSRKELFLGNRFVRHDSNTFQVTQGPWQRTMKVMDDVAIIELQGAIRTCSAAPVVSGKPGANPPPWTASDVLDLRSKGFRFYLLRINDPRGACAQECDISDPPQVGDEAGALRHDCQTWGTVSGAPIIAEKDGSHMIVGVHVGGSNAPLWNVFAPVSTREFANFESSR